MKRAKSAWTVTMLAGAGLAVASPASAWFGQNIFKHISLTGNRRLGLHLQTVTGDHDAYNNLTYYGQGLSRFTDIGQMSVVGTQVLGIFNFNFQFADDRYQDPASKRISLNILKKDWAFDAGDINGTIGSSNPYMSFNRQLYGLQAGINRGRFRAKLLHSTAKSSAQTFPFAGNGTSGPYYLRTSQIIPDSVRVQVDGRELKYPDDFIIDSVGGSLTFVNRTVSAASNIVVSYESVGANTDGGTIDGGSMGYDFGAFGALSIGAIRQTDPAGNGLTNVINRFQGYGDASIPYFLQYEPLASFPIIVHVDGILQLQNVDYSFALNNPSIFYFRRAISSASTVDVTYTPKPTSSTRGDRSVTGIDYSLPLGLHGKSGAITLSMARGQLSNPSSPLSGVARGMTADYRLKGYHFFANANDIPDGFVSIDSAGFLRNERAHSLGFDFKAGHFTYGLSQNNASIGVRQIDNLGKISFLRSRSTSLLGHVGLDQGKGGAWRLSVNRLKGSDAISETRADITDLSYLRSFGKLNTKFALNRISGFGPISTGTSSTPGSIQLNTISLATDYALSNGWVFGAQTSLSDVKAGGQSGKGKDVTLSMAYQPSRGRLRINTGYAYSNSGELAALGSFQSGQGAGYNGNGFSGGYSGDYLGSSSSFSAGGTDLRRWQTTASYSPSERLNLSTNIFTYSQSGSNSSNSSTTGFGISTDYDLKNGQRVGLSIDKSDTRFIGVDGYSNTTNLDFSIGGKPKGPWTYRLGVGTLLSSGGSLAQNSLHYDFSLRHRLRSNQILGFDYAYGSVSNYQPQTNSYISASYEYQLFRNVSLISRYRIRSVQNIDPTQVLGAYDSRGLDFELNFNFGY